MVTNMNRMLSGRTRKQCKIEKLKYTLQQAPFRDFAAASLQGLSYIFWLADWKLAGILIRVNRLKHYLSSPPISWHRRHDKQSTFWHFRRPCLYMSLYSGRTIHFPTEERILVTPPQSNKNCDGDLRFMTPLKTNHMHVGREWLCIVSNEQQWTT